MSGSDERRRFFRINDKVDLFFRKVASLHEAEVSRITDDTVSIEALPQIIEAINSEAHGLMRRIEVAHPDTASYLKKLNEKIDIIAGCVFRLKDPDQQKVTSEINLSASGIAFHTDIPLEAGDLLELRILLPASRAMLSTCGRVIQCRTNYGVPGLTLRYTVSIDYVNLKDEDRDQLVKHITKRQIAQIREKNS